MKRNLTKHKMASPLLGAILAGATAGAARAAYLPDAAQQNAIAARMAQYQKTFPAGFMMQVGNAHEAGEAAYYYKFGDDTEHWRLEQWDPSLSRGFRVTLWRFYPERANRGIFDVNSGGEQVIEFEEPAANTENGMAQENYAKSLEVVKKSERAWQLLLTGTPNTEPFPLNHDHEGSDAGR